MPAQYPPMTKENSKDPAWITPMEQKGVSPDDYAKTGTSGGTSAVNDSSEQVTSSAGILGEPVSVEARKTATQSGKSG